MRRKAAHEAAEKTELINTVRGLVESVGAGGQIDCGTDRGHGHERRTLSPFAGEFKDEIASHGVVAGFGAIALWRLRRRIRPLLGLFACYAAMGVGLLAAIGYESAQADFAGQPPFPQARYLFPLLALYALAIVLATKALPRRWAPLLGGLLVALAFAHNLFAETLTISRYYG